MKKYLNILISLCLILGTASFVYAQANVAETFTQADTIVRNLSKGLIASLGYMLMGLAVVTFLFGVVQFIYANRKGDVATLEKGRRFMMWGIIALFVMFSMYGLVFFIQRTLGIGSNTSITLPGMDFSGGATVGSGVSRTQSNGAPLGSGLPASGGSGSASAPQAMNGCSRVGNICNVTSAELITYSGSCIVDEEQFGQLRCKVDYNTGVQAEQASASQVCVGKSSGVSCNVFGRAGLCGPNDTGSMVCVYR